jgi:hypothetical protein
VRPQAGREGEEEQSCRSQSQGKPHLVRPPERNR